jgi:SAM-dependent methyltransferase
MIRVLCGLASWFESAPGRRLLDEQTPLISESARRFHGDTLLWAGCHTDLTETVRGCMIRNHFLLQSRTERDDRDPHDIACFRAELEELPIPNNTLDAVVLHHVLETVQDPRTAIREVSRVLAPGGRLLIVSFNRWSLWGARGAYAGVFEDSFSGLRLVGTRRLLDWLTVLGFELQQEVRYLAYGLPYATRNSDARLWRGIRGWLRRSRLPVGGVFVMSAVKQVAAIRPDWSGVPLQGRKLAPAAYPKLSARIAHLPLKPLSGAEGPPEGIEDPG